MLGYLLCSFNRAFNTLNHLVEDERGVNVSSTEVIPFHCEGRCHYRVNIRVAQGSLGKFNAKFAGSRIGNFFLRFERLISNSDYMTGSKCVASPARLTMTSTIVRTRACLAAWPPEGVAALQTAIIMFACWLTGVYRARATMVVSGTAKSNCG